MKRDNTSRRQGAAKMADITTEEVREALKTINAVLHDRLGYPPHTIAKMISQACSVGMSRPPGRKRVMGWLEGNAIPETPRERRVIKAIAEHIPVIVFMRKMVDLSGRGYCDDVW